MSESAERLRGATRWSMASRCARMASYGLLGVEPDPPTPRQQGRFARGRDAGRYFARQMAAKHGEANVRFEHAVPWPAPPALPVGELHIDVGVMSERLAIEAKSSKWIDSMLDAAIIQVAGAVHFSPDFDAGLVVFLDGDYQITNEYPVFLNDELIEKVEGIAAAVVAAGAGGFSALPDRICEKPSDAISHMCPFADVCFQGWEPPEPLGPADFEFDLSKRASEGWIIQRDLRAAKGNVEELQARWDAWKEDMIALEVPSGVEIVAGPVKIKRIDVKGRETFSLAKARTAGVWGPGDEERFGPFTKIGEPSVRFDLTRRDGDLDLEFGDEAPF